MMNAGITLSTFVLESDLMAESTAMGEDIATEQIVALILLASLIVVATWLFFVWAIRDKQFEEVEEISLRVLELDAEPNHAEAMP